MQSFRPIYTSLITKNGFADPKSLRGFRESGASAGERLPVPPCFSRAPALSVFASVSVVPRVGSNPSRSESFFPLAALTSRAFYCVNCHHSEEFGPNFSVLSS